MSISGIKSKTQIKLNEELAEKWSKESQKRNLYFEEYGITTITFTDQHFKDIDKCFLNIVRVLEERPKEQRSISDSERSLTELYTSLLL
jgi:hypothetical protein